MDTVAVSGLPADRFAVASTKSPDSELDAGMDDLTRVSRPVNNPSQLILPQVRLS